MYAAEQNNKPNATPRDRRAQQIGTSACGAMIRAGNLNGMPEHDELGPTGGTVWSTPAEWAKRRTVEGCAICRSRRPRDIIADLPSCWVTAQRAAPLPGCVCVVARQHVVEPFEMDVEEQSRFWRDTMVVARAVDAAGHTIAEQRPDLYVAAIRAFVLNLPLPTRPHTAPTPPL
jgi:hypothetical protein